MPTAEHSMFTTVLTCWMHFDLLLVFIFYGKPRILREAPN